MSTIAGYYSDISDSTKMSYISIQPFYPTNSMTLLMGDLQLIEEGPDEF